MATAMASPEAQLHWLALHMIPGLGARNALLLVKVFGHPERVFQASLNDLRAAVPRLPVSVAESIHSGTTFEEAVDELRAAGAMGAKVVPYQDPRYPERLREIFDPPILLYALGDEELLGRPSTAIVGTRRPTPYGRAVAEKFGKELAERGLTVVSGMARGIDAASHRGALASTGATVAVLGTGVDTPYPKENRGLHEEIAKRGVVVSEFRLGTTPFPQNFPLRNRIIAGMSLGVLVVEGAQYSGSLITARLALDQGREVMAVPGNITSKPSWGPNLLIKDGAKLVQDAADVVEELPLEIRERLVRERNERYSESKEKDVGGGAPEHVSASARAVFRLLRVDEALHIDDIIRESKGESPADVLAALSELELFGAARQLPGKNFVRAWPQ